MPTSASQTNVFSVNSNLKIDIEPKNGHITESLGKLGFKVGRYQGKQNVYISDFIMAFFLNPITAVDIKVQQLKSILKMMTEMGHKGLIGNA